MMPAPCSRFLLQAALALTLLLPACARVEPLRLDPATVAVAEPSLAAAQAAGEIETYRGGDGRELALVAYRNGSIPARTAVVYLHGIESHAGWFALAARRLQGLVYDVYCLDRRGSGLNRENRGFASGDALSAGQLLEDLAAFVRPLRRRYPRVVLTGLSWGGKLALAYALEHPGEIDGLVLVTPGLVPAVDLSPLAKLGVVAAGLLRPEAAFAVPIPSAMFTTTPAWRGYIEEDPLRLRRATARFFLATRALDRRVAARSGERRTSTLLVLAGRDRIIDNAATTALLERGDRSTLTVLGYPDQTHAVQLDAPDRLARDMDRWLGADAKDADASWRSEP